MVRNTNNALINNEKWTDFEPEQWIDYEIPQMKERWNCMYGVSRAYS